MEGWKQSLILISLHQRESRQLAHVDGRHEKRQAMSLREGDLEITRTWENKIGEIRMDTREMKRSAGRGRSAVEGAIYRGPERSWTVWSGHVFFYKERQEEPARAAISLSPARAYGDLERCHVRSLSQREIEVATGTHQYRKGRRNQGKQWREHIAPCTRKTFVHSRATKISYATPTYAPTWILQMLHIYYLFHRNMVCIIESVVLDTHT